MITLVKLDESFYLRSLNKFRNKLKAYYQIPEHINSELLMAFFRESKKYDMTLYMGLNVLDISKKSKWKKNISIISQLHREYGHSKICVIPEYPYPYFPLCAYELLDNSSKNEQYSKFIYRKYSSKELIKKIYGNKVKVPRGPFPPGRKRICYLDDIKDFLYFCYDNFFYEMFLSADLNVSKASFIPEVDLGYEITNISSSFFDYKVSLEGIEGANLNFIKLCKAQPGNNIASGLFQKDGKIPKETEDEINSIINRLSYNSKINVYIPPEYINSFKKPDNNKGIFSNMDSSYPDLYYLFSVWKEIIPENFPKLGYTMNKPDLKKSGKLIVFTDNWLKNDTEKILLDYCNNGGVLLLVGEIPKYDIYGRVNGILKEHISASKEIIYGRKWFFKHYNIGRGSILFFPHKKYTAGAVAEIKKHVERLFDDGLQ